MNYVKVTFMRKGMLGVFKKKYSHVQVEIVCDRECHIFLVSSSKCQEVVPGTPLISYAKTLELTHMQSMNILDYCTNSIHRARKPLSLKVLIKILDETELSKHCTEFTPRGVYKLYKSI